MAASFHHMLPPPRSRTISWEIPKVTAMETAAVIQTSVVSGQFTRLAGWLQALTPEFLRSRI